MDPMGKAMLAMDRRGILDPFFWVVGPVGKLLMHSLNTFFLDAYVQSTTIYRCSWKMDHE